MKFFQINIAKNSNNDGKYGHEMWFKQINLICSELESILQGIMNRNF